VTCPDSKHHLPGLLPLREADRSVADAADGHGIHGKHGRKEYLLDLGFVARWKGDREQIVTISRRIVDAAQRTIGAIRAARPPPQWNHPESDRLPGVFPCHSVAIEKVTTPAKSPGIRAFIAGIIPAGSHCLSACGISGVRFL
jgi:hypothetical protein